MTSILSANITGALPHILVMAPLLAGAADTSLPPGQFSSLYTISKKAGPVSQRKHKATTDSSVHILVVIVLVYQQTQRLTQRHKEKEEIRAKKRTM